MRNTTIADSIYHYIQRYPRLSTFISVLLHYLIPIMETFKWWYYSAYMEEMTKRKKTPQNAIKISRILDKNRESHYLLL